MNTEATRAMVITRRVPKRYKRTFRKVFNFKKMVAQKYETKIKPASTLFDQPFQLLNGLCILNDFWLLGFDFDLVIGYSGPWKIIFAQFIFCFTFAVPKQRGA
jgi:hypothetical protein